MQTFADKFKSRKFLLALLATIGLVLDALGVFSLDPEQRIAFSGVVVAFIAGETVLDNKGIEVNADFAKRVAQAQLMSLYEQLAGQADVPGEDPADPTVGPDPTVSPI